MRISKNPFFSLPISGLFSNGSQRGFFNFFEKKDTFIDPKKKKLRKATISDYLVPGLVVISWILIFKLWWGAEEVCKKQYEKLAQQDATAYRTVFEKKEHVKNEVPEEFRSEYVKNEFF